MTKNFVRNGRVLKRHTHHLGARHFAALSDRVSNLARFAQPHTHAPAPVAHNYQRAEIESPSAFDDLGRTIDKYNFLSQLLFLASHAAIGSIGPRPVAAPAKTTALASLFRTRLGAGFDAWLAGPLDYFRRFALLFLCWFR